MKRFVFFVIFWFSAAHMCIFSQNLPNWISDSNISGNFRLREDYSSLTGENERYRTRIKFKLNFTTKVNDKILFGANFATGSSNPRTTNVTLGDSESKKSFNLDAAYIVYKYSQNLEIWAGKYKSITKTLFMPTDLMWDTDITPEGFGIKFKNKNSVFVNSSFIILDEFKASGADPFLYFIQPGISLEFNKWNLKGAVSLYKTVHAKGNYFEYSSGSNTLENGVLKYDYSVLEICFDANRKIDHNSIQYFRVFGNYLKNSKPDTENEGFSFGFGFGKKIKKYKDFSLKAMYRYLEKDAWLDVLTDLDSFEGKTGVKGIEVIANYGLGKNMYLSIDYYNMKLIEDGSKNRVLQFDINFKF